MSAGITRVHGSYAAPSQRPSTLSFFQITFAATVASEVGVVNGAIDQTLRACANFATVGMVGTLQNTGTTLVIALEDTGTDTLSPSGLGKGSASDATNYGTTHAALQAAIQALGTVNGKALGSATVADFVL
jgi:hypothetical protein